MKHRALKCRRESQLCIRGVGCKVIYTDSEGYVWLGAALRSYRFVYNTPSWPSRSSPSVDERTRAGRAGCVVFLARCRRESVSRQSPVELVSDLCQSRASHIYTYIYIIYMSIHIYVYIINARCFLLTLKSRYNRSRFASL